jgi:hypothetical protein
MEFHQGSSAQVNHLPLTSPESTFPPAFCKLYFADELDELVAGAAAAADEDAASGAEADGA